MCYHQFLVGPILRLKCMDAQCISNTTRVCLKAMEKHFFLLTDPAYKSENFEKACKRPLREEARYPPPKLDPCTTEPTRNVVLENLTL